MAVTLRQLEYFIALARHGNFGRAAAEVHVSQPALSVQIRDLERHLGGPLVERKARSAVLTSFGRQALAYAERIISEVAQLEEAARWRGGLAGHLRLGIIPTVAPYILPGALEALRTRDISLDVQVTEAKTERLIRDLHSGALDAIVIAVPFGHAGLVEETLFEDRFLLAGSAGRLDAVGGGAEALRPASIGQSQLLLLEDGHCLTDQALEVCSVDRGAGQINLGASSLGTLCRMVEAGFGLTLLPELALAAESTAAPRMETRRFVGDEPAREIGLVRRAGSVDDGWFTDLADVLRSVGEALVAQTRA
ncbi:LysR family transcriptional regulator, hydrogen peroxide-inducible genes activator [Poseidonocella pacifica]|uniref:LysR family transcriptional regulator, hydrogen peroxide-inducible genes activator n=1 Tax=Poseidonocella pacifica TaxID=871651 RepID=A0A1I0YS52_9RHOB|nr:hydrogen peroxide-inducible genes activator [Poseidonocella pacifica]SFB15646.1 LysR family transcriptional regulator, hydrogen peroxide-inducible genes activator [Poseidonocella pacifica]